MEEGVMNFNFRFFEKKNKPVKGVKLRRAPMRRVKTIPRPAKIGWLAGLLARFDHRTNKARV